MRKLHSTYLLFILIFSSTNGFARNQLSSVHKTASYNDTVNNINPLSPTIELEDGTTYYAMAMANEHYSSLSFAVTINVTPEIGNSQEVTFKYYPYPVKDYLNIRSLGAISTLSGAKNRQ